MSAEAATEAWWPALQKVRRAIVVVDMVESVRLMQSDEAGVIDRWRRFLQETRTQVLPCHGGRLVKSLGDGLLLEFDTAPAAAAAALALQAVMPTLNTGKDDRRCIRIRIGCHVAGIVRDDLDVYGSGVNLAARLATLAAPGGIVMSIDFRDLLVADHDGCIEDMGECYLKHVDLPQRAFGLSSADRSTGTSSRRLDDLRPGLAFLTLASPDADKDAALLAQSITRELTAAAARSSVWRVTCALSSAALAGRQMTIEASGTLLGADYLVSGELRREGERFALDITVQEVRSASTVCALRRSDRLADIFSAEGAYGAAVVEQIASAVVQRQMGAGSALAAPTLPGYALLLYGMALLHRLSRRDAARAREVLEHLADRHPDSSDARLWLAKWHFLQIAQAWSVHRDKDAAIARGLLARSLDRDPTHAMSLALDGHVTAFLDGDLVAAERRLREAVAAGDNEPLAWLFLSNVLTSRGAGAEAVMAVERARSLSPIDPLSFYFDLFAAGAYSAADRHEEALVHAQRSVAHNCLHLSGLVQLIIEQVLTGHDEEAHQNVERYLALKPDASVGRFLSGHTARSTAMARTEADALLHAGMPT